jgi:hypothetical protein
LNIIGNNSDEKLNKKKVTGESVEWERKEGKKASKRM